MIVIADTSALNYLVIAGYDLLLPKLFGSILIPQAVFEELSDPGAPDLVSRWIGTLPEWVQIQAVPGFVPPIGNLGKGETEGIALAEALSADLILIDDADARAEAERRRLKVTGTLGVLRLAALRQFVDLSEAVARLRTTNFSVSPRLLDELLAEAKLRTENRD
jgi:predicted nucleic acid-binding protein